jgi:UDP-N-acetylmuramate dehydrogenase
MPLHHEFDLALSQIKKKSPAFGTWWLSRTFTRNLRIPSMGSQHHEQYKACEEQLLELHQNVDLKDHSTMRVGGPAKLFAKVRNVAEVDRAYRWAASTSTSVCTIGSGSNIFWADEGYSGLVLHNEMRGFQVVSQDGDNIELHIGAGEILDNVVERSIQLGLTGLESLSLIPGTCGGAVIQNSGAYGMEISQVMQHVLVYDTHTHQAVILMRDSCGLGYRTSRFKNDEPGRFVILSLTIRLQRGPPTNISYPALLSALNNAAAPTSAEIRSAVIAIRRGKLPDPAVVPNCGSFFTNPVVSSDAILHVLRSAQAPLYELESGLYKVPAAWLIEHCGLKNHVDVRLGYGTWPGQSLVLFATRRSSCNNLLEYSTMIEEAVKSRFHITLDREPVLMRD